MINSISWKWLSGIMVRYRLLDVVRRPREHISDWMQKSEKEITYSLYILGVKRGSY